MPEIGRAEWVAWHFHLAYEELAPKYGYETRQGSRKAWEEVPENHRLLMIAVAQHLLDAGVIRRG